MCLLDGVLIIYIPMLKNSISSENTTRFDTLMKGPLVMCPMSGKGSGANRWIEQTPSVLAEFKSIDYSRFSFYPEALFYSVPPPVFNLLLLALFRMPL